MITLRQIEKLDLPLMLTWRNSEQVRNYVREYRYLTMSDQEAWYESYLSSRNKSDWGQEINIIANQLSPIGVGGFTRVEWRNRKAELTFYIGDNHSRTPAIIRQSLKLLITKGFDEYNFHKIVWPVYDHDPNLPIYKTVFESHTVLHNEYWWNGKWQDRHYLSTDKT